MNKYKYIIGVAAVSGMMASCSDALDAPNKSAMSEDIIFSTEVLADAAVMGIHQSFGETNSYRGRFVPYFGTNTDCEIFNNYGGVADPANDKEASLAVYSAKDDNSYMNNNTNAWAKLYEAIERANKAIESMKEYGDINTNSNMGQLYGELLTLRAMIYYDLVKAWGDVPYRFEPITTETIYLAKTDRVVILKKLLEDLLEAETYVGWPGDNDYTASTERVSKSFTKGLRARVALFLAGKSFFGKEKTLRYNLSSETERQQMYQIARDECKDVINSEKNVLGATFDVNFRNLCKDIVTAGQESIFEIPFSEGRGRVLYTWGVKHGDTDQWTSLAKGGVNGPTPTLWYDFDKDDARRDITCIPYQWKGGVKVISGASGGGWCFGKLRFEWMNDGKGIGRLVTSTNDDGINFQVMRYADILMMAAEAENQLTSGSIAQAKSWLKKVMDRAYPADKVTSILAAANTKDAFQQLIEDQRKFEFAGEAIRKVDLMRWGKLGSVLSETKQKMIDLANRQGAYAGYPEKIYYDVNLGQTLDDGKDYDADGYTIYGLEDGDDDATGKANYTESSRLFNLIGDAANENDKKVNSMINNFYMNDPDEHMFWPIWKYYIDGSNGMLVNDYPYNN